MNGHDDAWRQHLAMGIGKLQLVDDTGTIQTAQVQLSASETRDATPVMQNFGFQSSAPADSDVIFASLDAQRGKVAVIGTNHQASRMKGLARGGARQHDQGGRQVLINNDGLIQLFAPGEVLHKLVTDVFVALFNSHTHPGIQPGAGNTGVPTQQMSAAHLTTATRAGT